MKQNQVQQKEIRLGTHGEHYGSWMSNPVFYVIGAHLALSVVLAVLSFAVFHITALGVVRPVLRRRSGAAGPAGLDHMDTETVCLRRRRDDGAGAQDRPRAS